MSFSIDGRNLPAFTSFAACERHFKRRLTELSQRYAVPADQTDRYSL